MKTILFICILIGAIGIKAQVQPASPLVPCCENGQAQGLQYDDPTVGVNDIYHNCTHASISAHECVDRTRDGNLCSGEGSKYCLDGGPIHPRYYALWHPIIVSTYSMSFSVAKCAGNPSPQIFSITNGVWQAFQLSDDYTLNWSATKTQSWLTVSPSSGSISGTEPDLITVSINSNGLAVGTYIDTITVNSSEVSSRQWEKIAVTLNITSAVAVSISGPSFLACNQQGTWTATASCGLPPYYYVWYYYKPCNPASPSGGENTQPLLPPCGSWLQTGNNSPTYSRSDCSDFEVKCCVNDATNHSATSNIIYVSITGGFAKFAENDESQRTLLTRETLNNEFSFSQNYPNPFNPTTEIHFTLPMESHVQLVVYDMLGREVAQLVNEQMEAGYHSIQWNAGNMSSGIYIYKLSADNLVEVKRMVVTK